MKKYNSIFVWAAARQIDKAFAAWQRSGLTEEDMKDENILNSKLLRRMSKDKALALFLARRMAEMEKLMLGLYRLKIELYHGREHNIHSEKSRRLEKRIERINVRIGVIRLIAAAITSLLDEHRSSIKKLGNGINRIAMATE